MNPGLVVKLRPAGPWRIGPDSGARNRTDVIYHSDSLYSAVTSAMLRLGSLEEWLDATARNAAPAVCFSSCFPFLDEIGFVIPPRTLWPPSSPALLSARVRWKSARFVPLAVVQAIAHGQAPDENDWSIDGPSECLVPAGSRGPFLAGVRWSAAVDRLTGSAERHSTACIEFQPGAGLWTIVSFADEAARARWLEPVKAAFRLLADSGFGGERSRGWGRSDAPEFVEGTLPDMILGARPAALAAPAVPAAPEAKVPALPVAEPLAASLRGQPILAPLAVREAPPAVSELAAPGSAPVSPETPSDTAPAAPEPVPVSVEASAEPVTPESVPASLEASPEPEPAAPESAPVSSGPSAEAEPLAPESVPASLEASSETEPAAPESVPASVESSHESEPASPESAPVYSGPSAEAGPAAPESVPASVESSPETESSAPESASVSLEAFSQTEPAAPESVPASSGPPAETESPAPESAHVEASSETESLAPEPAPASPKASSEIESPAPESAAVSSERPPEAESPAPEPVPMTLEPPKSPSSAPRPEGPRPTSVYWLLSLFTPGAADTVDWRHGNYALMARGGRVESPAGSGELKKQIQMVAEGSVLHAASEPRGSASDVAPDGFAHPVFRAGFAVSIPLPEVS